MCLEGKAKGLLYMLASLKFFYLLFILSIFFKKD
jgi:hypothetical protein